MQQLEADVRFWRAKDRTTANCRRRLGMERLEARLLLAFDPSPFEQEMLEHINRMRLDPQGELDVLFSNHPTPLVATDADIQSAVNYFQVDGPTLESQWQSLTAAPPLAWNEALHDAATAHSQLMIAHDSQLHQLPGEDGLLDRIVDAGYNWSGSIAVAENIFAYTQSAFQGHGAFAIDWGFGPNGIQSPAGHRNNIMRSDLLEIGIAVIAESNPSTNVGPLVVTQDFGRRGNFGNPRVLGVVYEDANGNGRYDAGEQQGGVQVEITGTGGTFQTTTMSAGGYQVAVPAGTYSITASGGGLAQPMVLANVTVSSQNVKVDFDTTSSQVAADRVGVHRNYSFYLDATGDGLWNGTAENDQLFLFGNTGDTPLAGDWNGDGYDEIGVHRGDVFYLDLNGNGVWDGTTIDRRIRFGASTDTPLVGDWDGDGTDEIGVHRGYTFYLDVNGNGIWDGTGGGDQRILYGMHGDLPLTGDWNGDGTDEIGVHRDNSFYLDANGSDAWEGLPGGDLVFQYGNSGDTPLVGDWNADGTDEIGVHRAYSFYLDLNSNHVWDGVGVDAMELFGMAGDTPLVGKWRLQLPSASAGGSASAPSSGGASDGPPSGRKSLLAIAAGMEAELERLLTRGRRIEDAATLSRARQRLPAGASTSFTSPGDGEGAWQIAPRDVGFGRPALQPELVDETVRDHLRLQEPDWEGMIARFADAESSALWDQSLADLTS